MQLQPHVLYNHLAIRQALGGLDGVLDSQEPESEDRLDKAIKNWLELGKKAPKAKNDTRKKERKLPKKTQANFKSVKSIQHL